MTRLLLRDLAVLALTALLFPLSNSSGVPEEPGLPGFFGSPVSLFAGFLVALSGFLVHEWGHYAAARGAGARVEPASSLLSVFLFRFDVSVGNREQFLRMSVGGFAATAAYVLLLVLVLPWEGTAARTAWALTLLGVLATVILEFPPFLTVLRGGPLPSGVAYVGESGEDSR